MVTNEPIINKKKVYLITNRRSDVLLNLLKETPFISEVRIGSPNIIPELTESFLSLFDCFIYDFYNGGFEINTEKEKEIKNYIENDGGSFLVTHDQWDSGTKGPLNLIGLEYYNSFPYIVCNEAKVEIYPNDHQIYTSYNDLSHLSKMKIAETHKSFHIISSNSKAKVIMTLYTTTATNFVHDYLTVNELGKGRIAYWAAGHSGTISEEEKKLFINIVAWLTQLKK